MISRIKLVVFVLWLSLPSMLTRSAEAKIPVDIARQEPPAPIPRTRTEPAPRLPRLQQSPTPKQPADD
jgi:hypothetical protein